MTCPNCGNDNRDEATFCTQCGAPIPKRSGKLKRIFKWAGIGCGGLIGLFIVIIIIGAIASSGNDGNSVTAPVPTYIPLPTATFEEQKSVSTQIPYDDLFRNNEAHVGKKVWYEAKVVQVVEKGDDKYRLRADVTRGEYSWDDTVYLIYAGPRVLEDDIVQFVGIVEELYTYGAIFGNRVTIPAIRVINSRLVSETGRPMATPSLLEPVTPALSYFPPSNLTPTRLIPASGPTPTSMPSDTPTPTPIPTPTLTPTPIPGSFFTLGSSRDEVFEVQGDPNRIGSPWALIGPGDPSKEVWYYGQGHLDDHVVFSRKTGLVISWDNSYGTLNVGMPPGPNVTASEFFTVGSHQDDVARLQGAPSFIFVGPGQRVRTDEVIWSYGASSQSRLK